MNALVIGVTYNTDCYAIRFTSSLSKFSSDSVSVVLVDNSSRSCSEPLFQYAKQRNQRVLCLKAPANLGYFNGAALGLEEYLKAENELPTWVVVCNVDVEFGDERFFSSLEAIESFRDIGIVGPRIWSRNWNRDLNPKILKRPGTRKMTFNAMLSRSYYLQNMYEAASYFCNRVGRVRGSMRPLECAGSDKTPSNPTTIYAAHGSCLVFHRRYFDLGGSLRYPSFLFGEEIHVAEVARKMGLRVVHFAGAAVLDDEHASTGIFRSRQLTRYMRDSNAFLLETYFA